METMAVMVVKSGELMNGSWQMEGLLLLTLMALILWLCVHHMKVFFQFVVLVFAFLQDGMCHFKNATIGTQIKSYVNVTSGNQTALKAALFTYGPVAVDIDASHLTFSFYSSGVYYDPQCSEAKFHFQGVWMYFHSCWLFSEWNRSAGPLCIGCWLWYTVCARLLAHQELLVDSLGRLWLCADVDEGKQLWCSHQPNLCEHCLVFYVLSDWLDVF